MKELVDLLNEWQSYLERERNKPFSKVSGGGDVYALNNNMEIVKKGGMYLPDTVVYLKDIISKDFGLIEWLIDMERIDWKKLYGMALLTNRTKLNKLCSRLLMQDDPIECLFFVIN